MTSEPVPNGSSSNVKKLMKILAPLKKNLTLACRSVLAMTDKLWVKMRLCKCLRGGKKRGMPHLK